MEAEIKLDIGKEMSWNLLRAKLFAGGRGKHYAYHVTGDGLILRADVEAFYFALFSRMYDFWYFVAGEVARHGAAASVGMDEIDAANGEGDFTCIDSRCGKTYVDTVFPDNLPYAYLATRMTADEFKKAIVDAQAKAAERKRGCNVDVFHDGNYSTDSGSGPSAARTSGLTKE